MANKNLNVIEQAKLLQIYEELYKIILELLKKYDDPQLVASTLIGQGFRLYRGVLEDADFNDLLKHVVKENKKIKPLQIRRTIN
jgi:hypothetical protein